jgi:hypothetical protein
MTPEFDAYAAKHPGKPVPFSIFGNCLRAIVKVTRETLQKLHDESGELNARVTTLSKLYDSRLAALETKKGVGCWGGEFEAGKSYARGEFVRHKKSVWVAVRDCATVPGAHLGDWDLVIPGGQP